MSLNKKLFVGGGGALVMSEHYDVVEWTGNGASTKTVSGLSFSPDIVYFLKFHTSGTFEKKWASTVLGSSGEYVSMPGSTDMAQSDSTMLQNFTSDGAVFGSAMNSNGTKYVAFFWKAGGGTSPSYNTEFGIGLFKYTGNGASTRTITHNFGLSSLTNLVKKITGSGTKRNWRGKHRVISPTDYIRFQDPNTGSCTDDVGTWRDTSPNATTFKVGSRDWVNQSGDGFVSWLLSDTTSSAYFSQGSYIGNGSETGPIITTGFKPSLVIAGTGQEGTTGATWILTNRMGIGDTNMEYSSGVYGFFNNSMNGNFLNTGFQVNSTATSFNTSGRKYWYLAWADPDIVG